MAMEQPVRKTIRHQSRAEQPSFSDGTRILFHFVAERTDCDDSDSGYCIDDSRKAKKPMELIFGKEFKMPIWEECLKTMRVGEVSDFVVKKQLCANYFAVSMAYRQYAGITQQQSHHCCGSILTSEIGCPKLKQFMEKPCDLRFTFELLEAQEPGSFEKENWLLTPEERLAEIPVLREDGNKLFKAGEIEKAVKKYSRALEHIEALKTREQPNSSEFAELEEKRWPLLLNYAQCKFNLGDFYDTVRCCDMVLEKNPKNVKALFKKARANLCNWNLEESRKDFDRVVQLDPSLKNAAEQFLKEIDGKQRQRDQEDKQAYKSMFAK